VTATLSLAPVTGLTRPVVERLWQLYRHDLSEFRGSLPDASGAFHTRTLDPFLEGDDDRRAHIFLRDGPVGFALVHRATSEPRLMAEFFVVRAARRQGLGRAAVDGLLELYPGAWEIPFQEENAAAARFWRRVAAEVAVDGVHEEHRPVPGKSHIPPDVWLTFAVGPRPDGGLPVSGPTSAVSP
jgi:predicted acetyltransferase